jgi:NosR/NirI family nitrous oxide reductase transcriptional regulator
LIFTRRRLITACVSSLWLAGILVAASTAATGNPIALDCETQPCAEVFPLARGFRPIADQKHWEALDDEGGILGWIGLSTDFVEIPAYSGKPLITLVGIDKKGVITGARVLVHSEPILLVGIPEQALLDFVANYAGKNALERIVVGRAKKPGVVAVDAISGATVTVLAQNATVLETARALGARNGVFTIAAIRRGHFIHEADPWPYAKILEEGVIQNLRVSEAEMGISESTSPHVDLYFGVADASHIGTCLIGKHEYAYHMKKLKEGEHLFVVFNRGSGSFKGSAFVRGGIFDRIRIQQGLREITFRDTDYFNLPESGDPEAPEFSEGGLFILRDGEFDPSEPYELIFLGSRYDKRSAFSREFFEFTATHQIPSSVYQAEKKTNGLPWRQAWVNRSGHVVILGTYLAVLIGIFAARRYTTATRLRIHRLHVGSLVVGLLVVGVHMGAQPSVTQIFTTIDSLLRGWRWSLFLSEPLIFILWIFIFFLALIWGRGLFCGWVCPYGALNRLSFALSRTLGLPSFEFPPRIHNALRFLRYGILILLCMIYLWDSALAERMAEIEPFKSTFLVPAWIREWTFLTWWLLLLIASFFMYRPFCRYLCPLGAGLSILGSFRISPPRRRAFCGSCKVCSRDCLPRAIRPDGTINPRECLSCMNCEATYRNHELCPPLIGLARLESGKELTPPQEAKRRRLQMEAADI